MRLRLTMSLLAAGLGLAACGGRGPESNAQAAPAPANAGAPADATAVNEAVPSGTPIFVGPAPVAGVTRDFLIGSWATDSCDVPAATYAADGTTDGGRGRWTLDGDRLIVTHGTTREQSVIERLGDDRMRLNSSAGPFELHRCPAAAAR